MELQELQQRINFSLARMKLGNRRVKRGNDQHSKFVDTGVDASTYEVASGWIIDHLLFVRDMLWGFFKPLLSFFFGAIRRLVLIILANVIYFGAIYLLLTY